MQYPDMFKTAMVQKMTGPDALSASALSKQVDVPQSTLSKWLRMAGVVSTYGYPNGAYEYTKMAKIKDPKRPADWSAEEKLQVVMDAVFLDQEQLGAFLREKGLHQIHLEQWRSQMLEGLQNGFSKSRPSKRKPTPIASDPWKRSCIEKTKPWRKRRRYWSLKKKSSRSGGTRKTPQPGATADDHQPY